MMDETLPTIPDRVFRILVGPTDERQTDMFAQAWKRVWGPRIMVRHVPELTDLYKEIVDFKPDLLWASPTFLKSGPGNVLDEHNKRMKEMIIAENQTRAILLQEPFIRVDLYNGEWEVARIKFLTELIRRFVPQIKFVILSCRAVPFEDHEFSAMGIDGFLRGPCRVREMLEAISQIFPELELGDQFKF